MKWAAIVFLGVTFGLAYLATRSLITAATYLVVGILVWMVGHYLKDRGRRER